jgi:hypothetical protein
MRSAGKPSSRNLFVIPSYVWYVARHSGNFSDVEAFDLAAEDRAVLDRGVQPQRKE